MLLVDRNPNAIATENGFVASELIRDRLRVEGANLFMQEVYCVTCYAAYHSDRHHLNRACPILGFDRIFGFGKTTNSSYDSFPVA